MIAIHLGVGTMSHGPHIGDIDLHALVERQSRVRPRSDEVTMVQAAGPRADATPARHP